MTATPGQLAVGVVGTGVLGTRLAAAVQETDACQLAGLADINQETLEQAGSRLGLPHNRWYTDHQTMLEEAALDAVVIATPHSIHAEQIRDALKRGHDVLCEKPLCTTVDDARAIQRLAAETGRTVMVGYQRRVEPSYVAAKRHLEDQGVPVTSVTAEITQPWIDEALESWRGNPDLSGGGFLFDTGSHLLDAVLWLTDGTPTAVNATMEFVDDEQRVDEHASITIRFDSGAIATLSMSARVPRTRELIRVWTDQDTIEIVGREWNRRNLTVIDAEGHEESRYLGLDDGPGKVAAFADAIRTGEEPPATVAEAIQLTRVTQAAYESARTNRPVELPREPAESEQSIGEDR